MNAMFAGSTPCSRAQQNSLMDVATSSRKTITRPLLSDSKLQECWNA
jgi:hypothetical protein